MISHRKRKTCLVVCLAIAQAFVAHAIVPGLTLRPVEARAGSTRDAAAVKKPVRGLAVCRIKASNLGETTPLPGRRGRTDRCRAFFIAYKATPTKGPLDCLLMVLADYVRPLESVAFSLDAVRVASPSTGPTSPSFTSLTIELCRPRC